MPKYGSDSINPSYIESKASMKRKTKEVLRIDQLIPSEILRDSDRGPDKADIKTLLEEYYKFMNMDEFIYDQTEVFTDIINSDRAVFRIKDPTQDNNEFFSDFDGANSTLVLTNDTTPPSTTTIALTNATVQISNGNELPGTLKNLTTEVGKTFSVLFPVAGAAGYVNHNTKSAVLTTPVKHWVGPGPSYILNAIEEALNIDENTDDYLELMQKEIAQAIPRNLTVDKRSLYKNIVDFYKLKGTTDSIEIFFRLLFNENVETEFPFDKTLIPSSGKWDTGLERYLDHKGFLSDNIKLQDSKFYQKFSYVVRTGKNLSDWGPAFEKLVHPAGFIFFGEILILTQLTRAVLGDNVRQDLVELDRGFSEGTAGKIPVPGQPGYVYTYKDVYGRLNRKTLSSMPGLQPGVIGAEDVALLVEMFASTFLPNLEAKRHESGQLSVNLNASNVISSVSIVNPGFGYPVNLATESIVNGQKLYTGPAITVSGDAVTGQTISDASISSLIDGNGRIDTVTISSGGNNYATASASPAANTNQTKIAAIAQANFANKSYFSAPGIILDAPTAKDSDGVPLASNVQATARTTIGANGKINAVEILNVGFGYVTQPKVRIDSATSSEERAQDVKEIAIIMLNHVATEVNSPNFRTLINNNYFNNKKESYYSNKKFRDGYPISFFSDNTIQNSYSSVINNYNTKTIIHQE